MDLPWPQSMYKLQSHQKLVGLRELRPIMSVLEERNEIWSSKTTIVASGINLIYAQIFLLISIGTTNFINK